MNAPAWVVMLISACTDFLIVAGSTITGAMLATDQAQLPTMPVLVLAAIAGCVAAGKEVRSMLKLPEAPKP